MVSAHSRRVISRFPWQAWLIVKARSQKKWFPGLFLWSKCIIMGMAKETSDVRRRRFIEQLQKPSFETNPWLFLFPEGGERQLGVIAKLKLEELENVAILRTMPREGKLRSCWLGLGEGPETIEVGSLDNLDQIFHGGKARGIIFFTRKSGKDILPEVKKLVEKLNLNGGKVWILEEVGKSGFKKGDEESRLLWLTEEKLTKMEVSLEEEGYLVWTGTRIHLVSPEEPAKKSPHIISCGDCGADGRVVVSERWFTTAEGKKGKREEKIRKAENHLPERN